MTAGTTRWCSNDLAVALLGLSAVSLSYIAVDVVGRCSDVPCPLRDVSDASTTLRQEPSAALQGIAWIHAAPAQQLLEGHKYTARSYSDLQGVSHTMTCLLKSEAASIATVLASWSVALLALFSMLSFLAPKPKRDEMQYFRRNTSTFILAVPLSLLYALGVSGPGYSDVTCMAVFESWRYTSRQLRSALSLRSAALRRGARTDFVALARLLAFEAAAVVVTFGALVFGLKHRAALSPMLRLELFALPIHGVHFLELFLTEASALLDELAAAKAASADAAAAIRAPSATAPPAPPSTAFAADVRADAVALVAVLRALAEHAALVAHHAGAFWAFGVHARVIDGVMLYELAASGAAIAYHTEELLMRGIAGAYVSRHLEPATPGAPAPRPHAARLPATEQALLDVCVCELQSGAHHT
jgi:hypothetical protein